MKKNFFKKYRLISFVCFLASRFGIYLRVVWSNDKSLPTCERFGLAYTNRFEDYTFRLRRVYIDKENRKKILSSSIFVYSKDIKFILTPNYHDYKVDFSAVENRGTFCT